MASRLQDVILRGLAADKPLATAVAPGTLYYSSDSEITERSNGTAWESYSDGGGGGGGASGITQLTGDVTAGPGSGSVAATLSNTTVTPGSYTNSNVTVDAKGRIISASSGTGSAAHAPTHAAGGSDPVTLTQAQITNLTTDLAAKASTTDPRFTDARVPLAHAASHSAANSDPITVTNLAGYPGGTTNFLRADGTFAAPAGGGVRTGTITMIVDGIGAVLATGLKGYLEIPFACTITGWTLLADVSGSVVVDIWKDTYANYPPVVGDTITASAKPTITAALKSQDTTLTGWTTSIVAGDVLAFNVDSVTAIKRLTLSLKVQA